MFARAQHQKSLRESKRESKSHEDNSPDSAFGSEELEESFETQSQKTTRSTYSRRKNCDDKFLKELTGTRSLTLPRTQKNNVTFTQLPTPTQGTLLRFPSGSTKSGKHSDTKNRQLKLKPFTNKEKTSWLRNQKDHGFIRLFDPNSNFKVSLLVPCTTTTTSSEIGSKLNLEPNILHLQLNGTTTRRLQPYECPLTLQNEYLETIGLWELKRKQQIGDSLALGFLIRFFAGRPQLDDGYGNQPLQAYCQVRKGRVFHQWSRKLCILEESRVFIYPSLEKTGDPEVLPLARSKVEDVHLRSRGRCMKLSISDPRKPAGPTVYLGFDSVISLNAWLSRCTKASAKIPPASDLSNLQLEQIPDQVFAVGTERLITQLNLRHNNLRERPIGVHHYSRGWLEDLARFQSLRSLNLADNDLQDLPKSLLQLHALTELILSSNRIADLPLQISKLRNLQVLNLQNNLLTWLPNELAECSGLSTLDVSFNRLDSVPDVFLRLYAVSTWYLYGNRIENLTVIGEIPHVKKMFLSRNILNGSHSVEQIGRLRNLTHLDIQNNQRLRDLDVRSLHHLQVINCLRNKLVSLQVNGTSLMYLCARTNALESLTVMPVPQNLRQFDVSCNQMTRLPEWLTELSRIERIVASNNRLASIPQRLFTSVSSLKTLILNHNEIRALPCQIENCFIEVLHLHHNRLTQLPMEFLASTHKLKFLNLAQNNLACLPPLNPFQDLNKVQHLVLSANRLTDSVIPVLSGYRRLRILDIAYNHIKNIENSYSYIEKLQCLEEVNISGNRLQALPAAFSVLPNLGVIRAHSNHLMSLPDLSRCYNLKVLDVGNNALETIDVRCFLAPQLKHLDLSCNPRLYLDTTAFRQYECQSDRLVSMIDMDEEGKVNEKTSTDVPWQAGFSESSGERNKLCISQIRIPLFEPFEDINGGALFGIVDGGLNNEIPYRLQTDLPEMLMGELHGMTSANCDHRTLHYALINAHQGLESVGQKMGASVALCHIIRRSSPDDDSECKYVLQVANLGHSEAVLCRKGKPLVLTRKFTVEEQVPGCEEYERIRQAGGIITEENEINGITPCSRLLGCSFLYPSLVPVPHVLTEELGEPDEFLIIASRGLWDMMSKEEAVRRIRYIPNPILAAKHLQEMAQSYGYTENMSVLVVRFFFNPNISPTDVKSGVDFDMPRGIPKVAAYSEINIADNTDTLSTDDEIRSEYRGQLIREKPNYYFEYKRKLKEMMLESTDSTSADSDASLETVHKVKSYDLVRNYREEEDVRRSEMSVDAPFAHSSPSAQKSTVQDLMNASFHSEVDRTLEDDESDREVDGSSSLTPSLERLKPLGSNGQIMQIALSKTARSDSSTCSSGLGKSLPLTPASLSYDPAIEQSRTTSFQLVGLKRFETDSSGMHMHADPRPEDYSLTSAQLQLERHFRYSRQRYEAAREQILQKLQLRTPDEADTPIMKAIDPAYRRNTWDY